MVYWDLCCLRIYNLYFISHHPEMLFGFKEEYITHTEKSCTEVGARRVIELYMVLPGILQAYPLGKTYFTGTRHNEKIIQKPTSAIHLWNTCGPRSRRPNTVPYGPRGATEQGQHSDPDDDAATSTQNETTLISDESDSESVTVSVSIDDMIDSQSEPESDHSISTRDCSPEVNINQDEYIGY